MNKKLTENRKVKPILNETSAVYWCYIIYAQSNPSRQKWTLVGVCR